MKKVLVAYSANNVAAREFIIGVFKFINEGHDWNVHMLGNPYEITPETIRNALRDGTDGILTGLIWSHRDTKNSSRRTFRLFSTIFRLSCLHPTPLTYRSCITMKSPLGEKQLRF